MNFAIKSIATVFGIGYSPVAPGTISSLFCLVIYWFAPELPLHIWGVVIAGLFLIGVWVSTKAEKLWGYQDPSFIVIDEFVGQLIAVVGFQKQIYIAVGAFILFRLLDIIKFKPMNYVEKLPKGWGIMMDDVLAGIIAYVILQCIILLI